MKSRSDEEFGMMSYETHFRSAASAASLCLVIVLLAAGSITATG